MAFFVLTRSDLVHLVYIARHFMQRVTSFPLGSGFPSGRCNSAALCTPSGMVPALRPTLDPSTLDESSSATSQPNRLPSFQYRHRLLPADEPTPAFPPAPVPDRILDPPKQSRLPRKDVQVDVRHARRRGDVETHLACRGDELEREIPHIVYYTVSSRAARVHLRMGR